jgi:hypothetical protein
MVRTLAEPNSGSRWCDTSSQDISSRQRRLPFYVTSHARLHLSTPYLFLHPTLTQHDTLLHDPPHLDLGETFFVATVDEIYPPTAAPQHSIDVSRLTNVTRTPSTRHATIKTHIEE